MLPQLHHFEIVAITRRTGIELAIRPQSGLAFEGETAARTLDRMLDAIVVNAARGIAGDWRCSAILTESVYAAVSATGGRTFIPQTNQHSRRAILGHLGAIVDVVRA